MSTNMKSLLAQWYKQGCQYAPSRVASINRKSLIKKFAEAGFTEGAEIGVDRATFSSFMFEEIPNLHLWCVDPWELHFRGESRHISTCRKLEHYNATIVRKFSMDALIDVPDESLDFVYIDANHEFDYVMRDIIEWSKKVKIGGVVAGHDYYRFRNAGVVAAVDVYTRMHGIEEWFVTDEQMASFFWIREHRLFDKSKRKPG